MFYLIVHKTDGRRQVVGNTTGDPIEVSFVAQSMACELSDDADVTQVDVVEVLSTLAGSCKEGP